MFVCLIMRNSAIFYISALLSYIEQSKFIDAVSGLLFGNYSDKVYPDLLQRLKKSYPG
jgi:muramoyltetrapeptide carboxypeptidase